MANHAIRNLTKSNDRLRKLLVEARFWVDRAKEHSLGDGNYEPLEKLIEEIDDAVKR